jgi:hypothetical protein
MTTPEIKITVTKEMKVEVTVPIPPTVGLMAKALNALDPELVFANGFRDMKVGVLKLTFIKPTITETFDAYDK